MGPGHVGQGLCWGQGKPLGLQQRVEQRDSCSGHSLPVTASSAYTTGTRNTGEQTPPPAPKQAHCTGERVEPTEVTLISAHTTALCRHRHGC